MAAYDSWNVAFGSPSAWGIAWVHSGIAPAPPVYPPPQTPGQRSIASGLVGGGIALGGLVRNVQPFERKPIVERFSYETETQDRRDIEAIVKMLLKGGFL